MLELLDVRQRLLPDDSRKNLFFPFTLEQNCPLLRITFSYAPKELWEGPEAERLVLENLRRDTPEVLDSPDFNLGDCLPLQNLLTLSADRDGEYRGCHHCHTPNQRIHIGPDSASEGFYPGPVGPGRWQVVLSVHAVVVPCVFRIRVFACDPSEGETGEEDALC